MKTKTRAFMPAFLALSLLLALSSCGEQTLTGAQGPKGDQGSQGAKGDQGRSAQAWLETDEGQTWFHGTTIEAWQVWINSSEGQAWLASPEGRAWLASAAGQAWQAWMDGPEGQAWLAKISSQGASAQDWLESPEGQSWLADAIGNSWLLQPSVQDWLESPEGQAWISKSAINAWHAYIKSPEGQEWLASMQLEPDVMAWIEWLAGPEGLEWLKTDEGQFWLTGHLSNLEQPSPVASTVSNQSVFSDVDHIYLIGSWNSEDLAMATFAWEKTSGPGNPVIANPASPVTAVSGLEVGEYSFKFTVFNLQGESDSADAAVSVAEKPPTYGYKEFLYTGKDQLFTVPEGVSKIYVTACGGGGAGFAIPLFNSGQWPPQGGSGAAAAVKIEFPVTPGQQLQVSIGAPGKSGTDGGDTVLSLPPVPPSTVSAPFLTLNGGKSSSSILSQPLDAGGPGGGKTGFPGILGSPGMNNTGSSGGGGSLGGGGGATYNSSHSEPGRSSFIFPNGTPANGYLGIESNGGDGGIGAGGGSAVGSSASGGAGGPGYCLIEWWQ